MKKIYSAIEAREPARFKTRLSTRMGIGVGLAACILGAAGILLSSPAFAQTKIEQMIVTAQKRAQDIQSVPASITAFSGDALEERQLDSIQDMTSVVPNLHFATNNQNPLFTIRGISPDGVASVTDPSVALHIDGVYQPRIVSFNLVMTDLEAFEVLRGPQGTVYGRNANAGVINLVTRKPSDVFEGKATVFGGNYGRYGAKGFVSGPVADGLSVRVSGLLDRDSGYCDNYFTGNEMCFNKSYGLRMAVRAQPVENLTIDLAGSRSFTSASQGYGILTIGNFNAIRGTGGVGNYNFSLNSGAGQSTLEPWKFYNTFDPQQSQRQDDATLTITWDATPDITVKSITGYVENSWHTFADSDGMPLNVSSSEGFASSWTISQEFNVSAKLWDRLDLVAGLYYLDDQYDGGLFSRLPLGSTVGVAPFNARIRSLVDQRATSKAMFMDATISITDELRLLGGVRRTFDKKEVFQTTGTVIEPITIGAGNFPASCQHTPVPDLKYTSTTGKIGLQYDVTDTIMVYVQWQNGFKTGGYNPSQCGNSFAPEDIKSWEGGLKSTLFDDRVTFNVTGFSYNYTNLQLARTVGLTTRIDNAARAKLKGGEIEIVAYLTDDLRADLGVGLLDTKYVGYFTTLAPGLPLSDLSGNQLTKAPKATINFGLEYTMRVGDFGELKTRGEMFRSSRVYFTPFNEQVAKQDAYTVFNANLTFTPDDSPYQLQFYAKNITNKAYVNGANTSTFLNISRGSYAPPRTFGAEATVKF